MRDHGGSFFLAATVSVILTQIKPTPPPLQPTMQIYVTYPLKN